MWCVQPRTRVVPRIYSLNVGSMRTEVVHEWRAVRACLGYFTCLGYGWVMGHVSLEYG